MPIAAESLSNQLERGLSPVYLVAGDELLLVQECVDAIRRKARQQGFSERVVLFADRSFDWLDLAQAAESQSLFAERKIIELRIPTGKAGKQGSTAIIDYLGGEHGSDVLLVTCNKMDKAGARAKWVQALDKSGVFVHIWPVKPAQLQAWIKQRMQALQLEPDADAVQMLADRLEGNLLAANQEIQKLRLLKDSGRITVADVRECVADSASFNVFRLIECAQSGQLAQAFRIVAGLKASGAVLPMMVGALAWELGLLEQIQGLAASGMSISAAFRQARIWQSRQQPMQAALERLSAQDLQDCLQLLAKIDRQSKGADAGDPWITLDDLVTVLAGQGAKVAARA